MFGGSGEISGRLARALRRLRRRLDPPTLRAAWWATRSLRRARKDLRALQVADVVVAPPPPLPKRAGRGVDAVLKRVPNTCLERSLVLQRWLVTQGISRDIVIGVTGARDFRAHAWLEGEPTSPEFRELTRLPAP